MEKRRILIVDSEPDFVENAKKILEGSYEVNVAASRKEGLEKAKKECPNMAIVGFLEPRSDSFKFYKELREDLTTKNIPILVVDVRAEEHSRKGWRADKVMQMDAEGYLTRPVEPAELSEEVARVLGNVAPRQVEFSEVLKQMEKILNRVERIEKMLSP